MSVTPADVRRLCLQQAFKGEEKRDASAGIRGFLLQDLIAIQELLNPQTDFVCQEYLEDVTAIQKDGSCRIIQAKYYPSNLSMANLKSIFRELYFQYLKLLELHYDAPIYPVLSYYCSRKAETVTEADGWKVITEHSNPSLLITDVRELPDKKKPHVRKSGEKNPKSEEPLDKEEREQLIFDSFSTPQRYKDFYALYKYEENKKLEEFRKVLGAGLRREIDGRLRNAGADGLASSTLGMLSEDQQMDILLGLAVTRVETIFDDRKKNPTPAQIRRWKSLEREDFFETMLRQIEPGEDRISRLILAYLQGQCLEWKAGLEKRQKAPEVWEFLDQVCAATCHFFEDRMNTAEEQYMLLETITEKSLARLSRESYCGKRAQGRLQEFYEHRTHLKFFFLNLWRMMYFQMDPDIDHFLVFDGHLKLTLKDDSGNDTVLMSELSRSTPEDDFISHLERINEWENKPDKWYVRGEFRGTKNYSQDVSDICSDDYETRGWDNIGLIGPEEFQVECLECLAIGPDWTRPGCCKYILERKCKYSLS